MTTLRKLQAEVRELGFVARRCPFSGEVQIKCLHRPWEDAAIDCADYDDAYGTAWHIAADAREVLKRDQGWI